MGTTRLTTDRRVQRDLFVADLFDAAPKGDTASLEHPLFALKAGDREVRTYERNGLGVTVMPGTAGCATQHDKDVWIYCISQLVEAINREREDVGPIVRFTAHDFLTTTNRPTSGVGYQRLTAALRRLSGTRIETSIATGGRRSRSGFGLVDSWSVVERDGDERMVAVEVELPGWLYRSIEAMQVLALHPDYFRLRRPLDRRVYELARKHCGHQSRWRVSLAVLHEKSGSRAPLKKFRAAVRELVECDELPGYRVTFDAGRDLVTFHPRTPRGSLAEIADVLA